jgi:Methyltransferase domain
MKSLMKKTLRRVGGVMFPNDPQDLKRELQRIATQTTAAYIREKMRTVQSVDSDLAVHDRAIDKVSVADGLVLEFGVFSGRTINYIASKRNWTVDGFDSFEGLPEGWRDGFDKGHFKTASLPKVRDNVRLHKGWFDESLPIFLGGAADLPIAYLHVDCDLYSSTRTIFDLLGNRIKPGTVIVFDEYFNYDGWENGEYLAFKEFVASKGLAYQYITYNSRNEQVAVVMK